METVAKEFSKILKVKKELQKEALKGDNNHQKYYVLENTLKAMLRDFLRTEFTTLSKEKFLILCDLVSSHRPVEPFSFLVSISIRKKTK